jgi:hypothetical protein
MKKTTRSVQESGPPGRKMNLGPSEGVYEIWRCSPLALFLALEWAWQTLYVLVIFILGQWNPGSRWIDPRSVINAGTKDSCESLCLDSNACRPARNHSAYSHSHASQQNLVAFEVTGSIIGNVQISFTYFYAILMVSKIGYITTSTNYRRRSWTKEPTILDDICAL